MPPSMNNSKEMIKSRMLKHALNYWSIKNAEDLDPVVKLILEALSSELYNLGNDIRDTEVRVLEKIATLLAPGFLTCPNTAHAILHGSPAEATELLSITDLFSTQKKISTQQDGVLDGTIDVFFSPVGPVKLHDAIPVAMATGNSYFSFDNMGNKLLQRQSNRGAHLENNVVWLGLKTNQDIKNLEGLSLYFDWKNPDPKMMQLVQQLLPLIKIQVQDFHLKSAPGLQFAENNADTALLENEFIDYDLLSAMEKDIKTHYDHKFITLINGKELDVRNLLQPYPPAFTQAFSEAELNKISDKLLWLKISFPAAITQETLNEIYIHTNAFPVMNRRLVDLKYRLKGGSNIVPLKTALHEQFLTVKSFSDDKNKYVATPYRKMEEEEIGTYTLRNGGIERFDGRNAKEFISYLLELLRSESSAFSVYGYDFIATVLREMNQRIALMEQKTKGLATTATELPHYIIAKPFEGHELMFAEYWTTLAELANNIRSGTKLQQYNKSKVRPDSIYLLSTTIGGKNRLKPEERINAFRYGLITRNRIITKEDIRVFCFHELGSRVSQVLVEKGIEMSSNPKQGFRRTIDIILTPQHENLGTNEWQVLCSQLEAKLVNRSGMSNHYRILLREAS
jgi:hypothetical protein